MHALKPDGGMLRGMGVPPMQERDYTGKLPGPPGRTKRQRLSSCWMLTDCVAGCEICLHSREQRQDIVAVLLPTGK